MKVLVPVYDRKVLLLQLVVMFLFSFILYAFLYAIQEEKQVKQELSSLSSQRIQLERIQKSVASYKETVGTSNTLKTLTTDPTWEQVDFTWDDLGLTELLRRIDNLSLQKKVFIMESFEAGVKKNNNEQTEMNALQNTDTQLPLTEQERFYHLRGYFLCPCP